MVIVHLFLYEEKKKEERSKKNYNLKLLLKNYISYVSELE